MIFRSSISWAPRSTAPDGSPQIDGGVSASFHVLNRRKAGHQQGRAWCAPAAYAGRCLPGKVITAAEGPARARRSDAHGHQRAGITGAGEIDRLDPGGNLTRGPTSTIFPSRTRMIWFLATLPVAGSTRLPARIATA
jgi:hypothetical protein